MGAFFLDACALIAFSTQEEGADYVEQVLISHTCVVHPINVYELYKDTKSRTGSYAAADELLDALVAEGLVISDASNTEALKGAATLKLQWGGKIAIPDVIGLAASKVSGAKFLTSDHKEMDALLAAGEPIEFFR